MNLRLDLWYGSHASSIDHTLRSLTTKLRNSANLLAAAVAASRDVTFTANTQTGDPQMTQKSGNAHGQPNHPKAAADVGGGGQDTIDALKAQVEQNVRVEGSAAVLINGFQARLQAGIDAALAGGATGQQLSVLNDFSTELKDSGDALAAAVAANTPGE